MTIEKVKETILQEFSQFMLTLGAQEKKISALRTELEEEIATAKSEVEFHKKESKRIALLSTEADRKNDEAKSNLVNSQAKLDEADRILEDAKKSEESIRVRQESISNQEKSATEHEQEANRKLKWAEMEERRLKFLEHKLNVILEDENIRKKLEELK